MLAFHNDPAIKAYYLARIAAHRAADELIHGQYWQDGKGCAVGCTIHSSAHNAYETELGIPSALAHLEDNIFEGLHSPYDQAWPAEFLEAIPVGADLRSVVPQFLVAILSDTDHGVLRFVAAPEFTQQRTAILDVVALLQGEAAARAAVRAAVRAAEAAARLWQCTTLLHLLREAPRG